MAGQLKVGVVGINRGWYFVEALKWCKETEVTALCDTNAERLAERKEQFGQPEAFVDFGEFIESGIDLVVIASPVQTHVPMAVEALKRGIHVFSEVPAASSLEQCGELVAAVRGSSAKYMMAENCCFMKPHMVVRNMARAGLFGELYYAEGSYVHFIRYMDSPGEWRDRYLFGRRGGTYLTHPLGPILDWMDDRVVTVNCVGTGSHVEPRLGGDDSSTVLCRTAKGGMVVLRNDMSSPRPAYAYAGLQGTRGAYDPDWGHDGKLGHRVCLYPADRSHGELEWQALADFEEEYTPEIWRDRPKELESQVHGGADGLTFLAFVDAIVNDGPSPIDVYRALDITAPGIVSEISAHQGGAPMAVPDFRYV